MTERRTDAAGTPRDRSARAWSSQPWATVGWVAVAVACTYLLVSGVIGILLKG